MDIKIIPAPISGRIEGIASKSFAHRALICACLAKGESKIKINTTSADIEATVSCLENLGARIVKSGDIYTVLPINAQESAVINCNESGSTLRFLLPVIAAMGIKTEINASGRLPERPLSPLKEERIRMGAEISDTFPLTVSGKLQAGEFTMRGDVSSQFVTGLLCRSLLYPARQEPCCYIALQKEDCFRAFYFYKFQMYGHRTPSLRRFYRRISWLLRR